jgi:hypothetical protein
MDKTLCELALSTKEGCHSSSAGTVQLDIILWDDWTETRSRPALVHNNYGTLEISACDTLVRDIKCEAVKGRVL